jgi:hypothetical protein
MVVASGFALLVERLSGKGRRSAVPAVTGRHASDVLDEIGAASRAQGLSSGAANAKFP